jgi:hypothetical protein
MAMHPAIGLLDARESPIRLAAAPEQVGRGFFSQEHGHATRSFN